MCHHKAYALLVVVAEQFLKLVWLIVLTSQADYKHRTCIGVEHKVAEYLAGVLVVVRQLGAAVVVGIGYYAELFCPFFHHLAEQRVCIGLFLAEKVRQLVHHAVHTADGGHYPHFVAYAYLAVLAAVATEGGLFFAKPFGISRVGQLFFAHWSIAVVEQA